MAADLAELFHAATVAATTREPVVVGDRTYLVVPDGHDLQDVTPERDAPRRKKGKVAPITTAALIDYTTRHVGEHTVAYYNPRTAAVRVVYDDHGASVPGWFDHEALLTYERTPAWQAWTKIDRQYVDQVTFAEFVEDHLGDIAKPAGADLLEMAQTITGATSAQWKSAKRLRDGQTQVAYIEETTASAGKDGTLTIPERLELLVAPFEGAERVQLTARLRYRIKAGGLTLAVILDDPAAVMHAAVEREVATFVAAFPSVPVIAARV